MILLCFSSTDYGTTFPNITSNLSPTAVIHYYYVCPKNRNKVSDLIYLLYWYSVFALSAYTVLIIIIIYTFV